jgi:HSP20 family protein
MSMLEPLPPMLRDVHRLLGVDTAPPAFLPPADVLVSNDGVTIHMDVPGLGRDRLDIDLENDVLTIRGERPYPYPTDDAERVVRRVERGFGRFERSLRVPRGLDAEAIDASLHDGVLTLRIPRPASQKSQRIEIKEGNVVDEASGSPELATAGSKS